MQGNWIEEFGLEYDVPAIISSALTDISWHNDVCPTFTLPGGDDGIVLWVDHPDATQREMGGSARFSITVVGHRKSRHGRIDSREMWRGKSAERALEVMRAQPSRSNPSGRKEAV